MAQFHSYSSQETLKACKNIAATVFHKFLLESYFCNKSEENSAELLSEFHDWLSLLATQQKLSPGILYTGFYYFLSFSLFQVEKTDFDIREKLDLQEKFQKGSHLTLKMYQSVSFNFWKVEEIKKLLGVTLWIASKYQDDSLNRYASTFWSSCAGISSSIMTRLETHIIKILNFQLYVSEDNIEITKSFCFHSRPLEISNRRSKVASSILRLFSSSSSLNYSEQSLVK